MTNLGILESSRSGARSINFTGGSGVSASNIGITGGSNWTVATWFKIPSGATSRGDLCGWGVLGTGTIIGFIANLIGDGDFFIGTGSTNANTLPGVVSKDAWHHVAGTYDGTTLTLYLDGVSAATATVALNLTNSVFYFGTDPPSASPTVWTGKATRPEIWSRCLGSSEVAVLAAQGTPASTNLKFNWLTTEGSGAAIGDPTGGNPITLSGSYAWSTDVP